MIKGINNDYFSEYIFNFSSCAGACAVVANDHATIYSLFAFMFDGAYLFTQYACMRSLINNRY